MSMSWPITEPVPGLEIDRAVCLLVDERHAYGSPLLVDFERYLPPSCPLTFFFAGKGRMGSPQVYDHIDIEPPSRTGYPAWVKRPNSYNAFLCFLKIVERAKEDGVESLLILEDDAFTTPDFPEVLAKAWDQLQGVDPHWHALYLGANHKFSPTVEVSPNLLRLNGSGCWHSLILSHRAFDHVLNLPMEGPIDGVFAKYVHPMGHCYATWPNIARTKAGFSLCEGREVDYSEFWNVKGRA